MTTGQTTLPFRTVNHIGVSGGKDSTALLLWAVHESGYPPGSIDATFCDTGNEHPATLEYIAMLCEKVFPIKTLRAPLTYFDLAKKRGMFPHHRVRFCTTELKMFPTRDHAFELEASGCRVLLHSGVRASESSARALLPEREFDLFYALEVVRPLLRWTIDDVWAIHKRYGIKRNPLYDLGASRVGCWPCMMCRKSEIRLVAKHSPDKIVRIAQAEKDMGSTFFPNNKTPARFHSENYTTKKGEQITLNTIHDVVRWAETGSRARGVASDDVGACSSSLGACE